MSVNIGFFQTVILGVTSARLNSLFLFTFRYIDLLVAFVYY